MNKKYHGNFIFVYFQLTKTVILRYGEFSTCRIHHRRCIGFIFDLSRVGVSVDVFFKLKNQIILVESHSTEFSGSSSVLKLSLFLCIIST